MPKRYEVRIEFETPNDLVLDMDEDDYEEFQNSDDYQILWDLFEYRITDHLAGWTTIDYATTVGAYEEDDD